VGLNEAHPAEFALSRPVIVRETDGGWSMWYARRCPNYRLGFAFSLDGVSWTRADDAIHFAGQRRAWEARERTYPCVFDHAGRRYMLYNGDGYGGERV
jgi:hypothetical protein